MKYDGNHVDVPDEPIEGAWVVDYTDLDSSGERAGDGTDLINAHEAYFVLDYDTSYGAMGGNPRAFTTNDDAVGYVNSDDDLTVRKL
ncbi:nitrous oxide reductase accessory protein NosL [Natrinema hispanicum]|uniref:nitrous oxide reductase accessory protein NosL n=1 Tax=Natrinema hispanicum TaxID=392421 RepID=UPI001F5EC1B4|nr:nitrous oxide reductase accessory protein NosL [Natrinema hispanicum]